MPGQEMYAHLIIHLLLMVLFLTFSKRDFMDLICSKLQKKTKVAQTANSDEASENYSKMWKFSVPNIELGRLYWGALRRASVANWNIETYNSKLIFEIFDINLHNWTHQVFSNLNLDSRTLEKYWVALCHTTVIIEPCCGWHIESSLVNREYIEYSGQSLRVLILRWSLQCTSM